MEKSQKVKIKTRKTEVNRGWVNVDDLSCGC